MALVTCGVPAAIYLCFPIDFYSVKYFQVPAQTLAIVVASEAAVAAARWPRLLTLMVTTAFCAANLARDATLIRRGRGGYVQSIRHMIDESETPTPIVTAYSNHDFRTQLLIGYHQATMRGRKIRLFGREELPAAGAEWYILNDHRHGSTGAPRITDRHGNVYDRELIVRGGGIAPLHWYLYRRVGQTVE